MKNSIRSTYKSFAHYDFKMKELEFELGHEEKRSSDPVLRFGKYQGQRLSETPMNYRIWLKSQSWWKG